MKPLNINFLVNKCNGDRRNLKNELHKIEMFSLNKRNIKDEELQKLVCLSENKNISEADSFEETISKNLDRERKDSLLVSSNIFEKFFISLKLILNPWPARG